MRGSIGFAILGIAAVLAAGGCSSGGGGTGGAGGATTTTEGSGGATTTTTTEGTGGTGGGNGLPAGKCRKATDCKGGEQCIQPGVAPACGTCMNGASECGSDTECAGKGPSYVCEPVPCACSGQKQCVAGCTGNTDCEPGKSCGTDHRCAPATCAQQLDCPSNFLCPPIMQPHCERRTCSVDPECDVGFCVEGACYDAPGTCTAPTP